LKRPGLKLAAQLDDAVERLEGGAQQHEKKAGLPRSPLTATVALTSTTLLDAAAQEARRLVAV